MTRPLPHTETERDDEAARVAAYLAAHPGFLADRPLLYRSLQPPRRVHGEALADHMAALLAAARSETGEVAGAARAGQSMAIRAGTAVAALIGATEPLSVLAQDWPHLLGVETALLALEGTPAPGIRDLPRGAVGVLMQSAEHRLRDQPPPESLTALHGEAAPLIVRDALVRLPGPSPRLLVLGARMAACLPARGMAAPLRLLAAGLAAALDSRA